MAYFSDRLLTDAFDYNARKNRNDLDGNIDAGRAMITRLRLDALFFKKIVLTDVQVYHSLFLSGLSPLSFRDENFFEKIPLSSIEIRAMNGDLEQSLLARIHGENGELYPHLFTYIDPKNTIIRNGFKDVKSSSVRSLDDLSELLKRITLGDESEERARRSIESWRFWLSCGKDKRSGLTVKPWKQFPFIESVKKNIDHVINRMPSVYNQNNKNIFIDDIKNGIRSRGDIVSLIANETEKRTLNDDEFNKLQLSDAIYTIAYNKTLAKQHECTAADTNFRYFVAEDQKGVLTRTSITGGDVDIAELPTDFLVALGDMPYEAYNEFRALHKTNRDIMWEKKHYPKLKLICEEIVDLANKTGLSASAQEKVNKKLSATISSKRSFGKFTDVSASGLETLLGFLSPDSNALKLAAAMGAALLSSTLKTSVEDIEDDYLTTNLVDFGKARMGWETT